MPGEAGGEQEEESKPSLSQVELTAGLRCPTPCALGPVSQQGLSGGHRRRLEWGHGWGLEALREHSSQPWGGLGRGAAPLEPRVRVLKECIGGGAEWRWAGPWRAGHGSDPGKNLET